MLPCCEQTIKTRNDSDSGATRGVGNLVSPPSTLSIFRHPPPLDSSMIMIVDHLLSNCVYVSNPMSLALDIWNFELFYSKLC